MHSIHSFLFLVTAATSISAAEPSVSLIAELNKNLLAKQKSSNAYENTPPVVTPPTPVERKSFSDQISFLTDGQLTVMIPKGALIHAPAKHRISVQEKAKGKLVEWDEFLLANRNAIRLEPVGADQLEGISPIGPKAMELVIKANLPTLATYQNRVVSLPTPRPNPTPNPKGTP
jgi:hypothetical protein